MIVERCDFCELYDSDLAAAQSWGTQVTEVKCRNGGYHAIALPPTTKDPAHDPVLP